jgi:hypothetical protein
MNEAGFMKSNNPLSNKDESMKTLVTCCILLACLGCSSITVSYDYDKQVDFTAYSTYAFADLSHLTVNDFDKARIVQAVEKEMAARGYDKSQSADLLVDLQVKLSHEESATATTHGGAYSPWGYGFSTGFTTTNIEIDTYVDGTLFVNLIDAQQEKIVWQGRATKTLNEEATPAQHDSNINKAVASIFEKYPIQTKKRK